MRAAGLPTPVDVARRCSHNYLGNLVFQGTGSVSSVARITRVLYLLHNNFFGTYETKTIYWRHVQPVASPSNLFCGLS